MTDARFMGHKKGNEYAAGLGNLYNVAPKAVLAAIAYSYAARLVEGNGELDGSAEGWEKVKTQVYLEWKALHGAGIVPQAPPSVLE